MCVEDLDNLEDLEGESSREENVEERRRDEKDEANAPYGIVAIVGGAVRGRVQPRDQFA